jgi:hypothetical protein
VEEVCLVLLLVRYGGRCIKKREIMGNIDKTEHKEKAKLSKLAPISLVLGLVGFGTPFVLVSVRLNPLVLPEVLATSLFLLPQAFSVLFAVVALRQINRPGKWLRGRALAISGLVIAIVAVPLPLWVFVSQVGVYCKSSVITIDDATREMTVELTDEDHREFIQIIDIFITGELEGSATVDVYGKSAIFEPYIEEVSVDDRPWVIQGRVRLRIWGDLYDEVCFLKYEPVDVRSGSLKVPYVQQTDSSKQNQ